MREVKKYAVVIGNGAYTSIKKLNNPSKDAADMATALKALEFNVKSVIDGNLTEMEDVVVWLKEQLFQVEGLLRLPVLLRPRHSVQRGELPDTCRRQYPDRDISEPAGIVSANPAGRTERDGERVEHHHTGCLPD